MWINIKEKLPPLHTEVLIFFRNKKETDLHFICSGCLLASPRAGDEWRSRDLWKINFKVNLKSLRVWRMTHWMLSPALPD